MDKISESLLKYEAHLKSSIAENNRIHNELYNKLEALFKLVLDKNVEVLSECILSNGRHATINFNIEQFVDYDLKVYINELQTEAYHIRDDKYDPLSRYISIPGFDDTKLYISVYNTNARIALITGEKY